MPYFHRSDKFYQAVSNMAYLNAPKQKRPSMRWPLYMQLEMIKHTSLHQVLLPGNSHHHLEELVVLHPNRISLVED
jgi:hypothetical protein